MNKEKEERRRQYGITDITTSAEGIKRMLKKARIKRI